MSVCLWNVALFCEAKYFLTETAEIHGTKTNSRIKLEFIWKHRLVKLQHSNFEDDQCFAAMKGFGDIFCEKWILWILNNKNLTFFIMRWHKHYGGGLQKSNAFGAMEGSL